MKKYIFWVVFIVIPSFLNSCSDLSREDKLCYSLTNSVSERMKKKNGLTLVAQGVRIPNKIRGIDPRYMVYGEFTIDQARLIFVDCIEEILSEINSNQDIRPYLNEYPFTNLNVEIIVGFGKSFNGEVYPPYVSSVMNINNTIYYHSDDPETGRSIVVHSEPYEEGLRLVREACH